MKIISVSLCAILLGMGLCGCSFLSDILDSLEKGAEEIESDGIAAIVGGIEPEVIMQGVVAVSAAEVRKGPGAEYPVVGSVEVGTSIGIYQIQAVGDTVWAEFKKGWVDLGCIRMNDPDALLTGAETAIAYTTDQATIYSGPGECYGETAQVARAARVEVLGTFANWAKIQQGWIAVKNLYFDGAQGTEVPVGATVSGDAVNIRSGPGTQYDILTTVLAGYRVSVFYYDNFGGRRWASTDSGWICMDYLKLDYIPGNPLVGTWFYSEPYYDVNRPYAETYYVYELVFHEDGSYEVIAYLVDLAGSNIPDGTVTLRGNYSFDGKNLNLGDGSRDAQFAWSYFYVGEDKYLLGTVADAITWLKTNANP